MSIFGSLLFRVAASDERPAVLSFRKETFEREHSHAPLDRFDDGAVHLIALEPAYGIVSTARLVVPHQRPFDLEQQINFSTFLQTGNNPAMMGGFAVHPEFRHVSKSMPIQIGMLKLTCLIAEHSGVTDIVMYTFMHLVNFYKSASFKPAGYSFYHDGYKQEMVVMHMNLADLSSTTLNRRTRMSELFSEVNVEF